MKVNGHCLRMVEQVCQVEPGIARAKARMFAVASSTGADGFG